MAPVLKVFSYLPNPRVYKALIAARLCGVDVEVVGDKPRNLAGWLWDFEARPLAAADREQHARFARTSRRGFSGVLYKTDAFLAAQPFGTVPAAFSPDGETGIFESNSILRAVVRTVDDCGGLYGRDGFEASRIDSFLDANLVFAREAQVYLLAMETLTADTHSRMASAYEFYLAGIESTLGAGSTYLVGERLSIADISFACDFAQFLRERHYLEVLAALDLEPVSGDGEADYPLAFAHMSKLSEADGFAEFLGPYLEWYRASRLEAGAGC